MLHVFDFATEAAQSSLPSAETTDTRNTAGGGLLCVNTGNPSLLSNLQMAVREGRSLLAEDVGTSIDPVLDPVLCHRTYMKVRLHADVFAADRKHGDHFPKTTSSLALAHENLKCVYPSGPVALLAVLQCAVIPTVFKTLGEPARIETRVFCTCCMHVTREGAQCCLLETSTWNTTPTSDYT